MVYGPGLQGKATRKRRCSSGRHYISQEHKAYVYEVFGKVLSKTLWKCLI